MTDDCALALSNESKSLSGNKRALEKQLSDVKGKQSEIERMRKNLLAKVTALSATLSMDHQSLKVAPKTLAQKFFRA